MLKPEEIDGKFVDLRHPLYSVKRENHFLNAASASTFGVSVKLITLDPNHKKALIDAATDGNLCELWLISVLSKATIDHYISHTLQQKGEAVEYPFSVLHKPINTIIGISIL